VVSEMLTNGRCLLERQERMHEHNVIGHVLARHSPRSCPIGHRVELNARPGLAAAVIAVGDVWVVDDHDCSASSSRVPLPHRMTVPAGVIWLHRGGPILSSGNTPMSTWLRARNTMRGPISVGWPSTPSKISSASP